MLNHSSASVSLFCEHVCEMAAMSLAVTYFLTAQSYDLTWPLALSC